jgi:hypothetical protein
MASTGWNKLADESAMDSYTAFGRHAEYQQRWVATLLGLIFGLMSHLCGQHGLVVAMWQVVVAVAVVVVVVAVAMRHIPQDGTEGQMGRVAAQTRNHHRAHACDRTLRLPLNVDY